MLPLETQERTDTSTSQDPRPGTFYLLPKIHKPGNPGLHIIYAIGTITYGVSGYVDSYFCVPLELPAI